MLINERETQATVVVITNAGEVRMSTRGTMEASRWIKMETTVIRGEDLPIKDSNREY